MGLTVGSFETSALQLEQLQTTSYARKTSGKGRLTPDVISDILDISPKGLNLGELRNIIARLSALQNALNGFSSGGFEGERTQLNSLKKDIDNAGKQLSSLSFTRTQTSVRQVQGALSQDFNAIATNKNGAASVAQSLDASFSFTEIVQTTERFNITQTKEGLKIERVVEETRLVASELQANQSTTLVTANRGDDLKTALLGGFELADALKQYQGILEQFKDQLDQVFKRPSLLTT